MERQVSRWFRSYADTHRNSKIARLSDADFRLWHQLLCIAAENDGLIPPASDLKNLLSRRLDHILSALKRLVDGSIIDQLNGGYSPTNWTERQYKSDTSTGRVRQFRAKGNVSCNVSETAPDTEADIKEEKAMPDKSGDYAFFGQTIKLAPRHLKEWRRLFHTILDLEAELSTIDDWWQLQPETKRENWFLATKGMLNKKHQANLAIRKEQEDGADAWNVMP